MAAILMSIVAQYGMSGVFAAAVLAGILLILAGVFHLGRVTAYLPMPVITGFTSGIAVVIALGQVGNFFGTASKGNTAVEKLLDWLTASIFQINLGALALGCFVVLFMVFYPKRWNNVVPDSLVSIILATVLALFVFPDVARVGEIPTTLLLPERFSFSGLNFDKIQALLPPAISIAALGMIESLLCGASAVRMTGVALNSDRELIAQGVGNLLSPFFVGIPATAAIARTSVAIKSGAQTRLTGMIHALILLVVRLSRLEIHYDKVNPERSNAPGEIAQEYRSAQVVYVTGAVIFANTEQISAVYDAVKEAPAVIFSMRGTSYMDISGAQNFLQLIERLKNENKTIAVCGVSDSVCEMMHRSGIADCVGKEHFYWSVARALQSAQP